jgi:hypothetical protein
MAFVSVDSIVRNVLSDDGNTLHLYSQYLNYALRGVRALTINCAATLKTALLTVNAYGAVTIPRDLVNYTKIGVCGADGNIRVLGLNENICLVEQLNDCGEPERRNITGDVRDNNPEFGYFFYNYRRDKTVVGSLFGHGGGYNRKGHYKVDMERGEIAFASDMTDTYCVLEYITNGIEDAGQTMINELALEALIAWINWKKVLPKRNISIGEKKYFQDLYEQEHDNLKQMMFGFTMEEFKATWSKGYTLTPKM